MHEGNVSGLHRKSVSDLTFDLDGAEISVFEYFLQKYNLRLRYRNGPCLVMANDSFVPAEVMINDTLLKMLTPQLTFLQFSNANGRACIYTTALHHQERKKLQREAERYPN